MPLTLIPIEFLLRSVRDADAQGIIGPTFAAIGIGLLISSITQLQFLNPNEVGLSDKLQYHLDRINVGLVNKKVENFRLISQLILLMMIGLWAWSVDLSITATESVMLFNFSIPNYLPGILCYIVSMLFSEMKERL